MNREKTNRVEGTITAVVRADGYFDQVKAINVLPASMTGEVEAVFAQALTTKPCRLPPMTTPLAVDLPFIFLLE
jgi:hypothetical protein